MAIRHKSRKVYPDAKRAYVEGVGPVPCMVMLIGEAPGAQEDEAGIPFIGRSGQRLNSTLAEYGIERAQVFITNAVKCRPPENRTPTPEEILYFRPYLLQEIRRVKPKLIVTLGGTALKSLSAFRCQLPIAEARKRIIQLRNVGGFRSIPLLATYHPAVTFRNKLFYNQFKEDIQKISHAFILWKALKKEHAK